jgi:hypothetical protein
VAACENEAVASSNRDHVGRALELLAAGLEPFVERQMSATQGPDWMRSFLRPGQTVPRERALRNPALQANELQRDRTAQADDCGTFTAPLLRGWIPSLHHSGLAVTAQTSRAGVKFALNGRALGVDFVNIGPSGDGLSRRS